MFCVGLMLRLSENDTVLFPSNKSSLGIFNSSKIAPRVSLEDRQNPLQIVQSPALDPPSNSSEFFLRGVSGVTTSRIHFSTPAIRVADTFFFGGAYTIFSFKQLLVVSQPAKQIFFFSVIIIILKKTLKIENGLNSCSHFGFLYSEFDLLTVGN